MIDGLRPKRSGLKRMRRARLILPDPLEFIIHITLK